MTQNEQILLKLALNKAFDFINKNCNLGVPAYLFIMDQAKKDYDKLVQLQNINKEYNKMVNDLQSIDNSVKGRLI
ncbi:MAG: hypothetical protein IJW82_01115 [Clostridia bacterium]|nr:hypothetical protein [Clostridia bacterium]